MPAAADADVPAAAPLVLTIRTRPLVLASGQWTGVASPHCGEMISTSSDPLPVDWLPPRPLYPRAPRPRLPRPVPDPLPPLPRAPSRSRVGGVRMVHFKFGCIGSKYIVRELGRAGRGRNVVGGGSKVEDEAEGKASELPIGVGPETPGRRAAREGAGGGGMSCASVSIRGTAPSCVPEPEAALCALFTAGNAGGTSSSP